jgi:two-component system CheB/CheR fusion protein
VELALEQHEGEARVAVTDNGQGIAEAELPHVFERFWQAEPAGRGRSPGLGLGLQLVHYIVEKHGGDIAAESAGPGRGARFTVWLPGLIGGSEGLHGIGVLALDDDRDTLDWLQHFFAAHGATTWVAHTAEEAMRLAARVEPDVLISNLRIGATSGPDLIQGLRAQHLHKRVATLAFSAQPTGEERKQALAAGYDAFIERTSQPDPLLRAVRAAVKGPSAGPGAALRW